jgi:hypothetical protein
VIGAAAGGTSSTVTLITAIVALGLSACSLTWQAATFVLSGPRIRVRLAEGLRNPTGGVMVAPKSVYSDGGRKVRAMGYTQHVLLVQAENSGRLPATVSGWKLQLARGHAIFINPEDPLNPPLPHRLESHSSQSWAADAATILATEAATAVHLRGGLIYAALDLGSRTVQSRNAFVVHEGQLVPARFLMLARIRAHVRRR